MNPVRRTARHLWIIFRFCFRSSAKSVPILAHGCWVTSEAIKSVNYYYQLLTGRGKESRFGGGGWRLEQKITQLKSVSVSVSVAAENS